MEEKAGIRAKVLGDICWGWDEVRICAMLIREGKARITHEKREDGSVYRYTKLK